jgi:hypothetical protein
MTYTDCVQKRAASKWSSLAFERSFQKIRNLCHWLLMDCHTRQQPSHVTHKPFLDQTTPHSDSVQGTK